MADERFKVGEIAEGCNHVYQTEKNGMECVIIEPLQFQSDVMGLATGALHTGHFYRVQWADRLTSWVRPECLRRRKPPTTPRQEVGEWELCPWQPKKVTT